ncbi:MAG: class I SAM-dependent methyltransferase [Roseomonas sp.]
MNTPHLIPPPMVDFLAQGVSCWWPLHVDESAWLEHTPFAAWLMDAAHPEVLVELGTHRAVSYMTFCQAAHRLARPTRCFAVDTWNGDAHTGAYGDEVFEWVKTLNTERYAGFSTLVRSTFSDALDRFQEKEIDLLHIDGLHTYEAVSEDFFSWLPKMSDRGIILFHDIEVKERDFGVWRLWDEVSQRFPSFSFSHGYGLGILAVGKHVPPSVNCLVELDKTSQAASAVREIFESLGARVTASYQARIRAAGRQAISDTTRDIRWCTTETRQKLLLAHANAESKILEIGPSHAPIAAKTLGWNTKTIDHATREKLIEKYKEDKSVDSTRIETVDFVWSSEKLDCLVPKELHGTFDLLIASHVIEHFPDPVGVLRSAETLLRPDTGLISLAVPDKRLCFDFFRPLSTTGKLLGAHYDELVRHSASDIFDSVAYMAFLGGDIAWDWRKTSNVRPVSSLPHAFKSFKAASKRSDQEYQDCHAWMFTPASFELLILELSALGVLDWHVQSMLPQSGVEFIVHLARGRPLFASEEAFEARRRALLMEIQRDLYEQAKFYLSVEENKSIPEQDGNALRSFIRAIWLKTVPFSIRRRVARLREGLSAHR